MQKVALYKSLVNTSFLLPLFSSAVQAGFPSPAEDYVEKELDLNELLVEHPISTFYVRVQGDSMSCAGICSGDILVVDRSLKPVSGKIVVAVLNGEFTVKRLIKKGRALYLRPENGAFETIELQEGDSFQVWGVVTYVIHKAT